MNEPIKRYCGECGEILFTRKEGAEGWADNEEVLPIPYKKYNTHTGKRNWILVYYCKNSGNDNKFVRFFTTNRHSKFGRKLF